MITVLKYNFRWGRASFGGFNKTVEKLSTRMNSALPDDDELAEEEDVYGVAERLRSIREGTYKTEQGFYILLKKLN